MEHFGHERFIRDDGGVELELDRLCVAVASTYSLVGRVAALAACVAHATADDTLYFVVRSLWTPKSAQRKHDRLCLLSRPWCACGLALWQH